MARSKQEYIIKVHYPKEEKDELELRKRMGKAYMKFVEDYIMTLPINDEEKNKLYFNVFDKLCVK